MLRGGSKTVSWRKRGRPNTPARRYVVTHVSGMKRNPCVRNGPLIYWSGQLDSNQRPAVPKTAALPGCAIPRSLRRDVDTRLELTQQGSYVSPRIEKGMRHPVARFDAVLPGGPSDHLQHPFCSPP